MKRSACFIFGLLSMVLIGILAQGCATVGGGQVDPIASIIIPKTLYDYGPTLSLDCTGVCNVGSCKEYNANMVICLNPQQFVTTVTSGLTFTVNQTQVVEALTAVCSINGYTSSMPPTVVAGGCTAQGRR